MANVSIRQAAAEPAEPDGNGELHWRGGAARARHAEGSGPVPHQRAHEPREGRRGQRRGK